MEKKANLAQNILVNMKPNPKLNISCQNFGTPSFEENKETLESKNKEETLAIDTGYSFINTIT